MRDILKGYKRELLFTVIIFVLWQLALIQSVLLDGRIFWLLVAIGLGVLLFWLISNYYLNAYKEISRFSEVLIKINLKHRFFSFFFTPLLLYVAVALYLNGVQNMFLKQSVLLLSTVTLYILMVHIRASYEKVFTLEKSTRFIFQLVDLILFYIGVTGFVLSGTSPLMRVIGTTIVGFLLLLHQLILYKQDSLYSLFILLLSTALVFVSGLFFVRFSVVAYPLYMTVMFYMIISLWSVRLSGILKVSDYLPPILFSLMAFMILLSF